MPRLIDAEKLPHYDGTALSAVAVARAVEDAPTVDAEPTEEQVKEYCRKRCLVIVSSELFNEMKARWSAEPVRHGRWEAVKSSIHPYGNDVACSVCGFKMGSSFGYGFCPNCGAKMDAPTQKSVGNALEALDERGEDEREQMYYLWRGDTRGTADLSCMRKRKKGHRENEVPFKAVSGYGMEGEKRRADHQGM